MRIIGDTTQKMETDNPEACGPVRIIEHLIKKQKFKPIQKIHHFWVMNQK